MIAVWGESARALASPELLRAYSHFGNPVIGAFEDDLLCGVSIAYLAPKGGLHLHSHITGVLVSHQHLGVGFGLKVAQRAWCLENGIDEVTWTFDPLLARNAHFNIRKLGASASTLLPDFYGSMDDLLNRDDATDRLEVHWSVNSPRVAQVVDGVASPLPAVLQVPVPHDYLALRRQDPAAARRWRITVRDQLLGAFDDGLEIVDFTRDGGYGLAPLR